MREGSVVLTMVVVVVAVDVVAVVAVDAVAVDAAGAVDTSSPSFGAIIAPDQTSKMALTASTSPYRAQSNNS